MTKTGSYVYIVSRENDFQEKVHKKTLNEAKFYGFDYFYKKEAPFYRFTKVPFPHLFYISKDYIVYVEYARLEDEDIPYVTELNDYDNEPKEAFELFAKTFNKAFVYDPEARTKSRDITKRKVRGNIRRRKGHMNRINHHNTHR